MKKSSVMMIAAAVLLMLGPGTVKGFAQTLALGIVLSMFTALFVTRLIINAFYGLGFKRAKWYGVAKEHKTVDFLSKKHVFIVASVALVVAGFVVMGVNKATIGDTLNYSLEFKGGTATTVTFNESRNFEEINAEIVPLVEPDVNVSVESVLWLAVNLLDAVPPFICNFKAPLFAAAGIVGSFKLTSAPFSVPIFTAVLDTSVVVPDTGFKYTVS